MADDKKKKKPAEEIEDSARSSKIKSSRSSSKKSSTGKPSTGKKSSAKKSTAKKSTAKKSSAKKTTAKKSSAKKSTAKKKTSSAANIKKSTDSSSKNKKTRRELAQETVTSSDDEYSDDYIDPDAADRGDQPKSVVTHLDEFRSRLMYSLLAIIIVSLGSFFFSEYILDFINRPYLATGHKLNVFNLTEGFILRLKAAFIAGIFVGLPVIVYHLWRYILPAINKQDRKFARLSIIAAIILLYGGMAFTYFFILPFAVKMLLSFTPVDMTNTIGASKYLSFVLLFSLGMGIMFELPIIIMILTRIGIVSPAFLISKRKYAIILLWIISAMITPPDILTQSMIAIPLMLLYELSIIISKVMVKRKKKKELEKLTS